jgi:TPR repeat protein
MYSRGLGIAASDKFALEWYTKAAAQDHIFAQYSLAVMHAFGKGVPVDFSQAAQWFRKAADQGMAQAQYNLGVLYENGQGVDKDVNEARKWYKLAADQGLDSAARKFAALGAAPAAAQSSATTTQSPDAAPPLPMPAAADPVAAAPAATATAASGAIYGSDWIVGQPADHYTLQIMSSLQEQALLSQLRQEKLDGDVAYFKANVNGELRYAAVFGVYPSQAAAEAARAQLPASLRKTNPWVRKFQAIQTLIQQTGQP